MLRYCCTREQYDSELRAKRKMLSPLEEYQNIVVNNRFRYEDGAHQVKAKVCLLQSSQSCNLIFLQVALLDIRQEIETKKEENEEGDEMRSGMMVESFLIHILGAMISMVFCLYLVYALMTKSRTAPRDPEQIPFLQERYSQVEKL